MSPVVQNDGAVIAAALGAVLSQRRQVTGLSPKQVSYRAYIQLGYLYSLERGARQPSLAVFFLLARALGLDPRELLEMLLQKMHYGPGAPPVHPRIC